MDVEEFKKDESAKSYKIFGHTHAYPTEAQQRDATADPPQIPESDVPKPNISALKNKQRRREAFEKLKREKDKEKRKRRKRKKNEQQDEDTNQDKEVGGARGAGVAGGRSKRTPRTIENTREPDDTRVEEEDDEVALEESLDELSSYYNREYVPKVLITTADRPHKRALTFAYELQSVVPNSKYYYRRGLALKAIFPQAVARGYTDVLVINHDRHTPNGLVLSHLPDGPTANFRMSSVKFAKEIKRRAPKTGHYPELVMNNFGTRLGRQVGRMIAALFPQDPQFQATNVCTFHNQRDYIFFRQHRYKFKSEKKCCLQEVGPRLTLRLQSLQRGTFDSKYGEFDWQLKRHEMETSRRRFFL